MARKKASGLAALCTACGGKALEGSSCPCRYLQYVAATGTVHTRIGGTNEYNPIPEPNVAMVAEDWEEEPPTADVVGDDADTESGAGANLEEPKTKQIA